MILSALLLQGSLIWGASEPLYPNEPSYCIILGTAESQKLRGERDKARDTLSLFVDVSRSITKEYNKRYAMTAAEMLVADFNDRDSAGQILEGIFRDTSAFVDSSLYFAAAKLYRSMDNTEKASSFQSRAEEQRRLSWGGAFSHLPPEEIDYVGLGVPHPEGREALMPSGPELLGMLRESRRLRRQP